MNYMSGINSQDEYSNSASYWNNKGKEEYEKCNYAEARKFFEKAVEIDPDYAYSWGYLGLISLCQGQEENAKYYYEQAFEKYNKLIKKDPKDYRAWSGKGNTFDDIGWYQDAIKCFNKSISINKKYARVWHNKGRVLSLHLERYKEGIKCIEEAIKLEKNNPSHYMLLTYIFLKQKKYSEALSNIEYALSLTKKDETILCLKGEILVELKQFQEAYKWFSKATNLNKDYFPGWKGKGDSLKELKKYNKAIKCYDIAIKLNEDYQSAIIEKGFTQLNIDKLSSKDTFEILYRKKELKIRLYAPLMSGFFQIGDYDKVDKLFMKGTKIIRDYSVIQDLNETYYGINKAIREVASKDKKKLNLLTKENLRLTNIILNKEKQIERIKKLDIELIRIRKNFEAHDKKQDIYAKESKKRDGITHRKLDSISEILTFMNDDISIIKQNGEKTLAGIHDLDQKMDKLSEISDKIYEEAKRASHKLIQENPEKFNEKKKELLDSFDVKYSEN